MLLDAKNYEEVNANEDTADANLKDRQKFHEEAFGEGFDEKVVLFPKNRIVLRKSFGRGHMVEAIGGGAAVYMQAASKVQASSEVDAARPEIADTKAQERGETPPSQRSVEVQISQEAREMAADPRQEKPIQA